jgi:signal transduction histidine kinase/ActR/RegA family two-component response regulator
MSLEGKNEKSNYEIIYRMRSKCHEWRWISNRYKIFKVTEKGYPERIIGTITDITKSKQSEEDLKRKNRALKVLSGCNEIIVKAKEEKLLLQNICDNIINIGGYALAWVGFAIDDERKSVLPMVWAGDDGSYLKIANISWADIEKGRGPVGMVIRTGNPYIIRDVKSDQNFIPWLMDAIKKGYQSLISLPLTEDNHTFGVLSIYSSNLNAFDKNEFELLSELSSDLSYGINAIRTKEKHDKLQEQFLQSQKMEAIGKLAGGIAHDFNNILTVVLGNTDLILSDITDEENILKLAQKIKSSTKKAASLTHQLLSFSRKQMIQPKILDLNLLVSDAQKMFFRLIGEDIDLILGLSSGLKRIKADPGQIDQIIMNLIVNAKDAMPEGGKIMIKTENIILTKADLDNHPDGLPGEYVCLEVSDTGTGIRDEIKSKIFEPFFTTKEYGRGTGLGLSVVYGIAKQNEGWIELESEVGKGTSFKIFFPGYDLKVDEIILKDDIISKYLGHDEKVFIVEDDSDIRNLVQNTLSNHGYEVQQSQNIKNALNIFNDNGGKFDMVFMDIVLPDGSGIEFYEKLHLLNPDLKVLFTSGYADEKAKWSIIQKKKYGFIQKPYEAIDLLKAIRRILLSKADDEE